MKSILCGILIVAIGILLFYLSYYNGYNQAMYEVETRHKIDSLNVLYCKMWKDDMIYIGMWNPSKLEANRRETQRIFNEMENLKRELK